MFEKEAEEYFEKECLHSYADTEEELKEDVMAAFKSGAEFGYNKVNEWRYPSKGELPKEHRKRYLIATPGLIVGAETRTNLGKDIVFVNDFGTFERASEVIAWRELPEPPKEEE